MTTTLTTTRSAVRAAGLRKAVYNYMHGVGLDADPRSFFVRRYKVPKTTVPGDLIRRALG